MTQSGYVLYHRFFLSHSEAMTWFRFEWANMGYLTCCDPDLRSSHTQQKENEGQRLHFLVQIDLHRMQFLCLTSQYLPIRAAWRELFSIMWFHIHMGGGSQKDIVPVLMYVSLIMFHIKMFEIHLNVTLCLGGTDLNYCTLCLVFVRIIHDLQVLLLTIY